MSDPVRSHRWQPTRLPHPWDSLGKNTGVGCYFLLQCVKVKSQSEVAQLCPTLSDPMDCSLPGSSVHEIFQARVLEWGAIAFSTDSFQISLLSIEIGQNLQTPNCHIIPSSPTRLLKLYVERHSKHIHTLVGASFPNLSPVSYHVRF